ncbi:MAG: response regulator [Rhodocyclaceae bacterium]|nr:response regulator [Rhodocyclaceae bacterium]
MSADQDFSDLFAPEPAPGAAAAAPWKILLVDDEPDIHAALRLALYDIVIQDRPLRLLDARSAAEARALFAEHPDIAVVLLDVVMETEQAGLELVRHIRRDLQNRRAQILIVTGQPGYAPQRQVVTEYEIDGYRLKSDLTAEKIFVSVYAALRTHQVLLQLENYRTDLERMVGERTAALQSASDRLAETDFAMEKVGIGIAWNDSESGRFLYANGETCRQLGYDREEILGITVSDINPDFPPEAVRRVARELAAQGGYLRIETRHRRKDGSSFPVEATIFLRQREGRAWFIVFSNDITVRKAAERELIEARDAAEAASRAKSTFLANMSHELRTPMNAIIGLTGLAKRHADNPRLLDHLEKVEQASRNLLGIINDILDISKIEAERMTLEQVDFRLGEVLENLVSLIGHKARTKGLELTIDLPPDLMALPLTGDPLHLGQILLNLAGNAVKFTSTGSVAIQAAIVEDHGQEATLRFEVRDTGIGIRAEDQQRLFTAFEQADGSMTRKYGGTGLGLAISKRLVQLMGGRIGVDSAPGQGSRFWFSVRLRKASGGPAPTPGAPEGSAEAQIRARHPGARVLLVEDEPINQEVSRVLLEEVGFRVDVAEHGRRAVDLANQADYALILMDMQMPVMNGIEATRAIRSGRRNARTPIVAMTANAFEEDRQVCLAAGMDDHVGKPIDDKVLFETLLRWLDAPR